MAMLGGDVRARPLSAGEFILGDAGFALIYFLVRCHMRLQPSTMHARVLARQREEKVARGRRGKVGGGGWEAKLRGGGSPRGECEGGRGANQWMTASMPVWHRQEEQVFCVAG